MSLEIRNSNQVLELALSKHLYNALIIQLNKDFQLSNIQESFPTTITPDSLKRELSNIIHQLIITDFDLFLNLLYRIDLSESKVKKSSSQNTEAYVEHVCFVILKREWQKVWLKHNYNS